MSLPVVSVNGSAFQCDGKSWHYVGIDAFSLFKRYLMRDGPNALVKPWLKEQKAIAKAGGYEGPIVLRVFRFAAYWNSFALDPWSYHSKEITAFTEFVADLGFYVHWTCGDAQQVLPDPDGPHGQQEHLNRVCSALVPTFAFVQTCNEPFKNGVDPMQIIPPKWGTYLRDSGKYGADTATDYNPVLDFASFHPGRGDGGLSPWPKWLIDHDDSLATMRSGLKVPSVLDEPIGFAEVKTEKRSNDPDCAFRMGLGVAYGGILMHFDDGIDCNSPRPVQRECEIAYFAGIKGGIR